MEKQNQQKQLPLTLNNFGKEWCLQGTFTDPDELAQMESNWQKLGHHAMIKNKNVLYVTRFKQ